MDEIVRRVTAPLIRRASEALDVAAATTGYSTTDTINRALQLYAFIVQQDAAGVQILHRYPDGRVERMEWSGCESLRPGADRSGQVARVAGCRRCGGGCAARRWFTPRFVACFLARRWGLR